MEFYFAKEMPEVKQDKWYNAAIKLKQVVGDKGFTIYQIMGVFNITGEQAMTLLHYLISNQIASTYKE